MSRGLELALEALVNGTPTNHDKDIQGVESEEDDSAQKVHLSVLGEEEERKDGGEEEQHVADEGAAIPCTHTHTHASI